MTQHSPAPSRKAEWRKPEVRKIEAGSAEAGGQTTSDGQIGNS